MVLTYGIGITKCCTNDRVNMLPNLWAVWGNDVNNGSVWLSILPTVLQPDFYSDRCGMPQFRFS